MISAKVEKIFWTLCATTWTLVCAGAVYLLLLASQTKNTSEVPVGLNKKIDNNLVNPKDNYPSKSPTDAVVASCEAWRMGIIERGDVMKFARDMYEQFPNKDNPYPTSDDWRLAVKLADIQSDCID